MADHIRFMTGYYPNRWLQFCWKYISPLLIVVWNVGSYFPSTSEVSISFFVFKN